MIRNEIAVLGQISVGHANILTLTDYFETLNNRTLLCVFFLSFEEGGMRRQRWKGYADETNFIFLYLCSCSANDD